jgi:hypothetical protein
MLGITVWLDGDDVEITGFVDAEYEGIATKSSSLHEHNNILPFSFKVGAGRV